MKKNKGFEDENEEELEEDLQIAEEDEEVNDEIDEEDKEPLFPFEKMPYQEKGENVADIHDYDMGSNQELNLGESEERTKRRTLGEERGAGHEP